jgi:hypothetical protein
MSGEKPASAGPLRNGNPRRDLATLPCCGARTRQGLACRQPAMRNSRCRFHGGKSTGARTQQGKAAQIAAHTVHGQYGDAGRRLRDLTRMLALAARLASQGIHPTADYATFGDWITARLAEGAAARRAAGADDPPPAGPTPIEPAPPLRPILVSVTPPRAVWRAEPRPRWVAAGCLRHRWPPRAGLGRPGATAPPT